MCLDHRKWNILAFRGRLMSLLELRSVGLIEASLPTGVSHIPFAGLGIPICTTSLIGTKGGDSSGNSMSLETPQ